MAFFLFHFNRNTPESHKTSNWISNVNYYRARFSWPLQKRVIFIILTYSLFFPPFHRNESKKENRKLTPPACDFRNNKIHCFFYFLKQKLFLSLFMIICFVFFSYFFFCIFSSYFYYNICICIFKSIHQHVFLVLSSL